MRIAQFLFLWLLACACVSVRAQARESVAVTYGGSGGTLSGGAITKAAPTDFQRLINGGTVVGDVAIRDAAKGRVGSVDVDMVLNRRMPWQQVARAVSILGKTVPYVATGVAFIELLDELRMRSDGTIIKQDPGVNPVPSTQLCLPGGFSNGQALGQANPSPVICAATVPALADAFVAWANSSNEGDQLPCTSTWCQYDVNEHFVAGLGPAGTPTYFDTGRRTSRCTVGASGAASCGLLGTYGGIRGHGTSTTVTACPASIDALNPSNSIPAGRPVGFDGKCRTGRYTTPLNDTQVTDVITPQPLSKARAIPAVVSLLDRGNDLVPYVDTPTATGPGAVAQPGTTTTTSGPSGTTTGTSTPTAIVVYNGPSYTWNDSTVVTTTNGGGTTTTTTTAPPAPQVETCGLPGKPPCKIDETGTPSVIPPFSTTPIDATKSTDATKQDTEIGRVINPGFGWFSVPPMATCAPIAWPGGVQINPCNGIEVVRSIMAYLWALYGAVWSFGVFRRSLPGAA